MLWIAPYYRIRFGRIEYVRAHWRELPSTGAVKSGASAKAS
jgi:hypothetical protein